jgi:hypothetical protein
MQEPRTALSTTPRGLNLLVMLVIISSRNSRTSITVLLSSHLHWIMYLAAVLLLPAFGMGSIYKAPLFKANNREFVDSVLVRAVKGLK